jgi:hypothetical protein
MGSERNAYRILGRNVKERGSLEDQGVDGKIILKRIPKTYDVRTWIKLA